MTNTRYASDWDQAYRPSYAKIRRTVVRHIQVHLYKHRGSTPKEYPLNSLHLIPKPISYSNQTLHAYVQG